MDWSDEGIFLGAKPLGEANAVAELFTLGHGRHLGLVRGGRSRRLRPLLQPGNRLRVTWRARLSEHLGGFNLELIEAHAARVLDDAAALAAIGSLAGLEEALGKAAGAVFGSGWGWLVRGSDGKLAIETTPNQDSPLLAGKTPLLGLDVWEHAYYIKYQNRRADYLAAIWNVIDWSAVAGRYAQAR